MDFRCATKTVSVIAAGQYVFMQGNPCESLFCIQTGKVAIRRSDHGGNERLVRLAFPLDRSGHRPGWIASAHQGGKAT